MTAGAAGANPDGGDAAALKGAPSWRGLAFQHGRLSMDAIYRMDFTAKMNVAAICAAMAFVGAIVIGVF